jgi:hypothetical protein
MNKLKKLYKEFFGITEQTATTAGAVKMSKTTAKPEDIKKLTDKGVDVKLENSKLVDEAQLDNHITEYRGGVEMVMNDPSMAKQTLMDILQWAEKKGFTVVTKKLSRTGKSAYIYFRLGENPGKEAQRIQGYVSQSPGVKHFRFNVRGEQARPQEPQL